MRANAPAPMKILHVIPRLAVDGAGPVAGMNSMIKTWLLNGHPGHVLAMHKGESILPPDTECTVLRPSFPARFGNSNEAISWIHAHMADYDVFIIHMVWYIMHLRVARALRRNRQPYIVIPHGSLDPFDLRRRRPFVKRLLGPLLVRPFLAGSAAVVCMTQREADCLVTYGAKCRTVVLPCAVEEEHCGSSREEGRKALGLREDEFVVLFLGRIDYKKGFPVLLPAFKRLVGSGIKTKLLVVGPDSRGYAATVHGMVKQLDLGENVLFRPAVVGGEKVRLLRAADCFALPSLNENLGRAILEAMHQGLPCVISNNVYICDDIERAGAGIVCGYDEDEVFGALIALAKNSGMRTSMGECARRLAKKYAPGALVERYDQLLRLVTDQRGKASSSP